MAASTSEGPPRRAAFAAIALLIAVFWPCRADADGWTVHTVASPSPPERLFLLDNRQSLRKLRIRAADGSWLFLKQCGPQICAAKTTSGYKPPPVPNGALPDAEVVMGTRGILSAWLATPTKRYRHGVLGDAVEAGALVAVDETMRRHTLELPLDSVFEDRKPRLADLDGDGVEEIVVIRSYLGRGAALAVVRHNGHGIEIKAETPPIGSPQRWLNPAGIADFDGDGRTEIAIVVTPHIGGTLEFWEYSAGRLVREMQLRGFSNHAIGSRVQDMSAVGDFDGDGVPDLAVPSDDRRSIRLISFANGRVAERAPIELPGQIVTELIAIKPANVKRPLLVTGLNGGTLVIIR